MSKLLASIFPKQSKYWKLVGACAIVLAMLLPGPAASAARPTKFSSVIAKIYLYPDSGWGTGWSAYPGTDKLTISGTYMLGCVASSDWVAIPAQGSGCDPSLNHVMGILQDSNVTVMASGSISGRASGEIDVNAYSLLYKGTISELFDPNLGLPYGINHMEVQGTWSGTTGQYSARGNLTLTLDPGTDTNGLPVLSGTLLLSGSYG